MGLTVFLLGYVLDAFIICVYVTKMEDWERLWGGDLAIFDVKSKIEFLWSEILYPER